LIEFRDPQGEPIYVWVDVIEPVETPVDYQLLLEFRVRRDPPPEGHQPQPGKIARPREVNTVLAVGAGDAEEMPLWYSFSSLNSLAKNQTNLRKYVLSTWEQSDFPEVRGERPGR